jgi:energy-coupling factor transport system permease protein
MVRWRYKVNANIYIEGKGPLYTMDPRAKVMAALFSCIYVFTPVSFYSVVGIGVIFIIVSLYSIGLKNTKSVFYTVLPMLIIMLLFSPLYDRGGTPLWVHNGFLILTKEGLLQSLLLDFRFLSITFACALLFTTTKMDEFMLGLQDFHFSYRTCLTISLVFRSIPGIFDSFNDIIDSHKLRRGADNKANKKFTNRVRNLFPTLTSALVVSLRSIPTLAMSLEARGYGLKSKRTNFHTLDRFKHPFLHSIAFLCVYVLLFAIFKY